MTNINIVVLASLFVCGAPTLPSSVTLPPSWTEESPCSYYRSRLARQILADELFPVLDDSAYNMSTSCPFHKQRDMMAVHEELKTELRRNLWRCRISECKKMFRTEKYMDAHLYRMHKELLIEEDGICLSDYCDILRCDLETGGAPTQCNEIEMTKRYSFCQAVLHKCFPPQEGELAHILYDAFSNTLCDRLSCDYDASQDFRLVKRTTLFPWPVILIISIVFFAMCSLAVCFAVDSNNNSSSNKQRYSPQPSPQARHTTSLCVRLRHKLAFRRKRRRL